VALDLQDGRIREARIALGGLATQPWRAGAAEKLLADRPFDDATANARPEAAFQHATGREHNAFKITSRKADAGGAPLRQAARWSFTHECAAPHPKQYGRARSALRSA